MNAFAAAASLPIPPLPEESAWPVAAKIALGLAVIALLGWGLRKIKNRREK